MQFANKEIQSNCLRNGAIWIYIVCLCLCIPHWTGWSGWLVVDPQGGWKPKVCVLLCYCHHSMLQFKISLRHKFTEKHWCFFLSLRHTHTHECSRFQIPQPMVKCCQPISRGFNQRFQHVSTNLSQRSLQPILRTTPWGGLASPSFQEGRAWVSARPKTSIPFGLQGKYHVSMI